MSGLFFSTELVLSQFLIIFDAIAIQTFWYFRYDGLKVGFQAEFDIRSGFIFWFRFGVKA